MGFRGRFNIEWVSVASIFQITPLPPERPDVRGFRGRFTIEWVSVASIFQITPLPPERPDVRGFRGIDVETAWLVSPAQGPVLYLPYCVQDS